MRDRPLEYYRDAIETGHIVVNAKTVPPSTLLKNGDVITHTLHRHEPPVTAADIGIVSETDDLLVIDKPAGVPVHPAGRYHFNSVMEILRVRYNNAFNPRPCNRLDRLTSGIMFVGKTAQGTDAFTTQLMTHTIRKEYIARVIGEFPEETVVCGQPILQISPKLGLNAVRANGKEARTIFKRVAYYPPRSSRPEAAAAAATAISNPSTPADSLPWLTKPGHSIVRCFPLTGRTHQIRVHLQFLGHPIANDPIYANQRVFGPQLWSGHSSFDADEAVMARLERMGKDELADAVAYYDELVDAYHARRAERLTGHECELCSAPLYSDPGDHELGIYLHARRYACAEGQWAFETALPLWAMPPAGIDGPTNVGPENDVDDEMFIMEREKLEASALPRAKSGGMVGRPANGVIDNGEKISQTHTKENS
jgi:tRNA pseudouridine synthase 9